MNLFELIKNIFFMKKDFGEIIIDKENIKGVVINPAKSGNIKLLVIKSNIFKVELNTKGDNWKITKPFNFLSDGDSFEINCSSFELFKSKFKKTIVKLSYMDKYNNKYTQEIEINKKVTVENFIKYDIKLKSRRWHIFESIKQFLNLVI